MASFEDRVGQISTSSSSKHFRKSIKAALLELAKEVDRLKQQPGGHLNPSKVAERFAGVEQQIEQLRLEAAGTPKNKPAESLRTHNGTSAGGGDERETLYGKWTELDAERFHESRVKALKDAVKGSGRAVPTARSRPLYGGMTFDEYTFSLRSGNPSLME